jgi:serine/threonine-protein kinase RsbW
MTWLVAGRCVPVTGASGGSEAGVVFDERFDAATLHLVREQVAACAAAAGMPADRATDVILAVHELAANSVRHGAGAGRLQLHADDAALRCEVSDAGPGAGPWPLRQGHGLWIVRAIADQVTASSGPHGSQVTAVFGWQPQSGTGHPGPEVS